MTPTTVTIYLPGDAPDTFPSGAVFLTAGNHFFSRMIRFGQTWSPWGDIPEYAYWSHAGIILNSEGDMAEALSRGVERWNMEKYRDTPYAIIDTHPSNEDLDQMLEFVKSVLEARYRYGYLTIASIIVTLLTGSKIVISKTSTAICSGMSSETLTRRGLIFPVPPSHMTPGMLGRKFRVTFPLNTLSPHPYTSLIRPSGSILTAFESVLVADYPQSLKRNIEALIYIKELTLWTLR